TVTRRERPVSRWLARTLAVRPRPKVERRPLLKRPWRETPPPARWAAESAWAMKGFARWLRVERMRPGRGWKSFSSAIAGPDNVRKSEVRQSVVGPTHLAPQKRTLPDRRKIPTKTTDRPSRTLRPFISPSVGDRGRDK